MGAVVVVYGFQQGWSQSWSMIAQYWYMLDPRPEVRTAPTASPPINSMRLQRILPAIDTRHLRVVIARRKTQKCMSREMALHDTSLNCHTSSNCMGCNVPAYSRYSTSPSSERKEALQPMSREMALRHTSHSTATPPCPFPLHSRAALSPTSAVASAVVAASLRGSSHAWRGSVT